MTMTFERLTRCFLSRNDRRTVAERDAEEKHQVQLEIERKRLANQRKMQTKRVRLSSPISHRTRCLQMVAEAIKQEEAKKTEEEGGIQCDFKTDDEDDETAYDAWKLRELERLKRDRKERDE